MMPHKINVEIGKKGFQPSSTQVPPAPTPAVQPVPLESSNPSLENTLPSLEASYTQYRNSQVEKLDDYGLRADEINVSIPTADITKALELLAKVKSEHLDYQFFLESDGDPMDYAEEHGTVDERNSQMQEQAEEAFRLLGFEHQAKYDKASDYLTWLSAI